MNGNYFATGTRTIDNCPFIMKLNWDLSFNFSRSMDCTSFQTKWHIDAMTVAGNAIYGVANAVSNDWTPMGSNT
jgi:hypothetical protein